MESGRQEKLLERQPLTFLPRHFLRYGCIRPSYPLFECRTRCPWSSRRMFYRSNRFNKVYVAKVFVTHSRICCRKSSGFSIRCLRRTRDSRIWMWRYFSTAFWLKYWCDASSIGRRSSSYRNSNPSPSCTTSAIYYRKQFAYTYRSTIMVLWPLPQYFDDLLSKRS